MNSKIESLLRSLEQQSVSSALAVADHIRTVAGNGPDTQRQMLYTLKL